MLDPVAHLTLCAVWWRVWLICAWPMAWWVAVPHRAPRSLAGRGL